MQTLCYYHSEDKEQANNETLYYFLFTLTVNVKLYLHIKNIIPYLSFKLCFHCNVSCRLIFESYLKYLEWLIIGFVAKYVESRYNIVDVVFAL
jgi:hypothetical protein